MDEPKLEPAPKSKAESRNLAMYTAVQGSWTDVREAIPRCRVKVPDGQPVQTVIVDGDRKLQAPDGVEIDYYEDYPEIRDEEVKV